VGGHRNPNFRPNNGVGDGRRNFGGNLGVITIGGSQTPAMEEGMIQTAMLIIMVAYLLESSS
jgi:hypothetical protein